MQIFTKTLGSSIPTQMTHQNESCFSPFWAADGTRIYFTMGTFLGARSNRSLWSVAVGGGQAEKVLDGVPSAALSPDGKTMVVMAPDSPGQYRLAFSSPPGAPPKPYTRPPLSGPRPFDTSWGLQFSPSGRYVGFVSHPRGAPEFWRIPLDGGPPEELWRATDKNLLEFTWLRDDRRIITAGGTVAGSDPRLRLYDLRTRTSRPLTTGVTQDEFPSLSPDGRTLAYATGEEGYDVIEVPLDGSASREVIATSRNEVAPAWAPDGVHFAYITDRNGAREIWLRNRADGSERLIVGQKEFPGEASFLDCAISPDGSRIAYRAQGSGSYDIWISPLSGEAPVRLWDDPARAYQRGSSWSPDGNWIAYYSTRDGKAAVLKARVGASTPPELVAYTSV